MGYNIGKRVIIMADEKIMRNNPVRNKPRLEPCPRCDSENTLQVRPWLVALIVFCLGIMFTSLGIMLAVIIIGIPFIIGGVIFIIAAPFLPIFIRSRMFCKDCNYRWLPLEKREKLASK